MRIIRKREEKKLAKLHATLFIGIHLFKFSPQISRAKNPSRAPNLSERAILIKRAKRNPRGSHFTFKSTAAFLRGKSQAPLKREEERERQSRYTHAAESTRAANYAARRIMHSPLNHRRSVAVLNSRKGRPPTQFSLQQKPNTGERRRTIPRSDDDSPDV